MTSASKKDLKQFVTNINIFNILLNHVFYIYQPMRIKKPKKKPGFLIDPGRKNNVIIFVYLKLGLKIEDKLGKNYIFFCKTFFKAKTSIKVNV